MHDIIMAHGRGMTERMALTETPDWQTSVTELVAGVSYTYREYMEFEDGLGALEGGPEAGDRAPDIDFAAGATLHEAFRHTGMTLVLMPGAADGEAVTAIASEVSGKFGHIAEVLTIANEDRDTVAAVYGGAGRLYLVRPDGYIAFRSSLDDRDFLFRYLDNQYVAN